MKRRLDVGTVIVLMLLVATVTWLVAQWQTTEAYNRQIERTMRESKEFEKVKRAKEYIESSFVGSWDEEKLLDGAVRGMMASLGDQWSGYLNAEDFQDHKASMDNRFVGIGVSVMYDHDTGGICIVEVYNNSPALDADLRALDIIVSVNGLPVSGMEYLVAVETVRGEANTPVMIGIYRPSDDRTFEIELIRREVNVESVRSRILEGDIGYIRIRNFERGTDIAFSEAVTNLRLAGVRGIIFDVRNNPGGLKQVMLPMLNLVLPEGLVMFQSREKGGQMQQEISEGEGIELPMMVIINDRSYSAAEFFAAALKEHGLAELAGEPTTGKGYAQVPIELPDGSGIILSTAEYFTPMGVSLADAEGLTPDYTVRLTEEEAAMFYVLEPGEDRQIVRAYDVLMRKAGAIEAASDTGDGGDAGGDAGGGEGDAGDN
ncbi:MAG: S41 family peptidase [Oscillospiraceae bacterium]|nr:S41 family peptidase [Oscillospiraceae bacterium]